MRCDDDRDGGVNYDESSNGKFLVNSIIWLSGVSSTPAPIVNIPSFPLEMVILTTMFSCAVILIFIYRKRLSR